MKQRLYDLHTHTTASDGTFPPSQNVDIAAQAGLAGLAITDHDTVAGVAEAVGKGSLLGLRVIPGVEISTSAGGHDIHVLGYFIRYTDETLLKRLASLRDTRDRRNEMIIAKLNDLGISITLQEVEQTKRNAGGEDATTGRPHIAEVLVRKGAVATMKEAFDRYLAAGAAAYVNPPRVEPLTAVQWIHDAGGAAVLAHPGLYEDDALVGSLLSGFDGIEVYHADHDEAAEGRYLKMAEAFRLIVTAGSDFHGERQGVVFHAPLGSRKVPEDVILQLEQCSEAYRKNVL